MQNDLKRVRVRVSGRVQGVYFRAWAREEADRLGVRGWVRNEADGSVTALVVGPEAAVDAMVNALRQGPPSAAVDEVVIEPAEPGPDPGRFEVRH